MVLAIRIINYLFLGIFTLEAILKLSAIGFRYFNDNWNIFDFFVVVLTLLGVILE